MNQTYIDTVRLLLDILPNVFSSGRFAIKGGTALNLFVQDMPRLSVDIDVAFIDHVPNREAALDTIRQELCPQSGGKFSTSPNSRRTIPTGSLPSTMNWRGVLWR